MEVYLKILIQHDSDSETSQLAGCPATIFGECSEEANL